MLTCVRILYSNLSFPSWTHGQYAFPAFSAPHPVNRMNPSNYADGSTLEATIPALRGVFNCTGRPHPSVYMNNAIKVTSESSSGAECPQLDSVSSLTETYGPQYGLPPVPYGGGPGEEVLFVAIDEDDFVHGYCPSFSLAFGYQIFGDYGFPNSSKDVTMVSCSPYIEQVEANVRFLLPTFTIDEFSPIDSSAKVLKTGFPTKSGMQPLYPHLFDSYLIDVTVPDESTEPLGSLVKAVIYGIDGVPVSELIGANNVGNLADGLERVFEIYMAQLLNSYGHSSNATNTTIPTSLPTLEATLLEPGNLRLVQSAISTRILEGLLAAMTLCAIVTFLTIDTKCVLPKNPCSIAAVGSLLAGSELLTDKVIPLGSEWADDKQLVKVFDGWLFCMGWWEGNGKYRFGIDIGQHPGRDLEDLPRVEKPVSQHFESEDTRSSSSAIQAVPEVEEDVRGCHASQDTFGGSVRRSLERLGYEDVLL